MIKITPFEMVFIIRVFMSARKIPHFFPSKPKEIPSETKKAIAEGLLLELKRRNLLTEAQYTAFLDRITEGNYE